MNQFWRPGLVLLACLAMTLTGCGNNNIFKQLVGDNRPLTTAQEKIDAAKQKSAHGDYSAVLPIVNSVISSNASADKKIDAYALKGVAILGKTGFNQIDVTSDLLTNSNSTSLDPNLINRLPDIEAATAIQSATALNEAAALAASNSLELDKKTQLTRGIANVAVVTSKINEIYDVSATSNVVIKDNQTAKAALADLLTPDSTGKTIVDYASNANDGITKGTDLSDTQQAQLDKVKDVPAELKQLNTALQGGAAYTYTDSGGSHTLNSGSSDSDVRSATTHIIQKANR